MSNDQEIREQLNRIERWIVGDEKGGQFGLVARMNNHATRLKKLELWVFRIGASASAIVAALGLIYKLATDWWPRR